MYVVHSAKRCTSSYTEVQDIKIVQIIKERMKINVPLLY